MKKLVALAMVLLVLLFAGCGGKATDTSEEGSTTHAENTQAAEESPAAHDGEAAQSAEAATSPNADAATSAGATATAVSSDDAVSGVQKALGELDQAISGLGQSIEVLESVE